MKPPVVSVIIPAFNYGRFIVEGITSLQHQSFADFECIVVDDGSTDDTREVVQQIALHDQRIKYLFQHNLGQPSARNTGIKAAAGKYIQFMDADDLCQPEKMTIQVKFLEEHPMVSVVYGEVFYFLDSNRKELFINRWGSPDEKWMPETEGSGESMVKAYASGNLFELGCGLFRAGVLATVGYFNAGLQGVEDYDLCFRLALNNNCFAFLKSPGSAILMRHHLGSYSKSLLIMYTQELKMRVAIKKELTSAYPQLTDINEQRIKVRLRQLFDLMIDSRRKKKISSGQIERLTWLWSVTSLQQKIYFYPRWIKAGATGYFN